MGCVGYRDSTGDGFIMRKKDLGTDPFWDMGAVEERYC